MSKTSLGKKVDHGSHTSLEGERVGSKRLGPRRMIPSAITPYILRILSPLSRLIKVSIEGWSYF